MPAAGPAPRSAPITREVVIDTAQKLIEDEGAPALTMRRLAAELGAAVTAIYWHVGNREALLDELVDRIVAEMGSVRASGATSEQRIASIARSLRRKLLDRPHLIGLAHEQGRTVVMFQPAQAALGRELSAIGIEGAEAAMVIHAIQLHVIAFVVLERTASRSPSGMVQADPGAWRDAHLDGELVARLAEGPDYDRVFEFGLRALITSSVRGDGAPHAGRHRPGSAR
jgi:TetR/AcrR family transcriptional regulator, tetracycline repressor protein